MSDPHNKQKKVKIKHKVGIYPDADWPQNIRAMFDLWMPK